MRQRIRKALLSYSAILFPLTFVFFSPYLIIVSAVEGLINASALMFGTFLISSIMFSRLFCGWLCPGGGVQDMAAQSNERKWNGKIRNSIKYIIWILWLVPIIMILIQKSALKIDAFYMIGLEPGLVITYFMVVGLIYFFALFTGKRGMCHSLCWMAPFMVVGETLADFLHIPRFRIKGDADRCISCGQCTKKCPMSLDVQNMVKSGTTEARECISCLECVDICPKKAIRCGILQSR